MQGLQNLGATCAINSFIQIFCRIDELRNSILNESNIPDNSLSFELKEILHLMHNENKSLSPNKFINYFYTIFSNIFDRREQLDIGELLYFLLDKLNQELAIDIQENNKITNIIEEHDNNIAKYNSFKVSKLLEKTQGSIINMFECKRCNHTNYNFEPFVSIQLDIGNDDNPCISNMFMNYLKVEERASDDWKCDKCKSNSDYVKKMKLWNTSNVLFLIIKRFDGGFHKNMKSINIDNNLIFKKGSIFRKDFDANYEIKAIGLHHGMSQQGGHYTAICKTNDKIIHYDDENINEIPEENFNQFLHQNNTAYLLVYELKKND